MTITLAPVTKEATMTLNKDGQSFFIDTPLGSIKVSLKKADHRKLVITYPTFFDLRREDKKDRVTKKFFEKGTLQPNWDLLAPRVNDDGELIGVCVPHEFSLELPQENDDE